MEMAVVGQADTAAAVPVVALDMQLGGAALAAEKEQERVDMATVVAVADLEPAALKAARQAAVLVPAQAMAQSFVEDMGTVQGRVGTADITQANLRRLLEGFLQVPVNRRQVPVAFACSVRSVPFTVRKVEQVMGRPQLLERGTL